MVLVHKTSKVLLSLGFLVFALVSLLLSEVDMILQEKERDKRESRQKERCDGAEAR